MRLMEQDRPNTLHRAGRVASMKTSQGGQASCWTGGDGGEGGRGADCMKPRMSSCVGISCPSQTGLERSTGTARCVAGVRGERLWSKGSTQHACFGCRNTLEEAYWSEVGVGGELIILWLK